MSRSWLNVPHVTQFDYADVTELEAFRDSLKPEMEQRKNKLTPLPFLLLAVARALREHPRFNAALAPDGANLVLKKYCHVGIAVDTPQGLVVPVIRDVDRKSVWELAAEARELADKARNRKLKLAEMQGACFTISSLGNIGGEGFTPIVNAPEVAILGVCRSTRKPVWDEARGQLPELPGGRSGRSATPAAVDRLRAAGGRDSVRFFYTRPARGLRPVVARPRLFGDPSAPNEGEPCPLWGENVCSRPVFRDSRGIKKYLVLCACAQL